MEKKILVPQKISFVLPPNRNWRQLLQLLNLKILRLYHGAPVLELFNQVSMPLYTTKTKPSFLESQPKIIRCHFDQALKILVLRFLLQALFPLFFIPHNSDHSFSSHPKGLYKLSQPRNSLKLAISP